MNGCRSAAWSFADGGRLELHACGGQADLTPKKWVAVRSKQLSRYGAGKPREESDAERASMDLKYTRLEAVAGTASEQTIRSYTSLRARAVPDGGVAALAYLSPGSVEIDTARQLEFVSTLEPLLAPAAEPPTAALQLAIAWERSELGDRNAYAPLMPLLLAKTAPVGMTAAQVWVHQERLVVDALQAGRPFAAQPLLAAHLALAPGEGRGLYWRACMKAAMHELDEAFSDLAAARKAPADPPLPNSPQELCFRPYLADRRLLAALANK